MDYGGEEVAGVGLGLVELGFEVIAECYELTNLCHDTLLLGGRSECKRLKSPSPLPYALILLEVLGLLEDLLVDLVSVYGRVVVLSQ